MTAIAEQMKAQGIKPRDVRLHIALAEFMNNGGTEERALALVRDVYNRARRYMEKRLLRDLHREWRALA